MWFLDNIVTWLDNVSARFWDAYLEVKDWVWPFYLLSTPLYYLYSAFYYLTFYFGQFNNWLDWAAGRIDVILSTWDIWSYFEYWFNTAENAWNWVINAFTNVWNIIGSWWSSAQYTVIAWVDEAKNLTTSLFNQANSWLASLQSSVDVFLGKLPSINEVILWWGNWWGNVTTAITIWWSGAVLEVQGLINTAFIERESWWAGWQDIRDQVFEFFTNPVEFVWARFTDWFLGPEE